MSLTLGMADIPYLPRGVRLHHDRIRDRMVLLAPEKAIQLDGVGVAILERIDGRTSFQEIVETLAQAYRAPVDQVAEDVQDFLTGLRARLYLGVQS